MENCSDTSCSRGAGGCGGNGARRVSRFLMKTGLGVLKQSSIGAAALLAPTSSTKILAAFNWFTE